MNTIEIDDEVFARLQELATPFVDSPNTVLRRVLLKGGEKTANELSVRQPLIPKPFKKTMREHEVDSYSFVQHVLKTHFGDDFRSVGRYRYMFESPKQVVYFQNFNQEHSDSLWYRLSEKALSDLRKTRKEATVCFTNPADGVVYAIPMEKIEETMQKHGWNRPDLEVNIDHAQRRWREFDWGIWEYLVFKSLKLPELDIEAEMARLRKEIEAAGKKK